MSIGRSNSRCRCHYSGVLPTIASDTTSKVRKQRTDETFQVMKFLQRGMADFYRFLSFYMGLSFMTSCIFECWGYDCWILPILFFFQPLIAPVLVTTASKFFGKKMALSSCPKEADVSCYLGGDWKLANSSTPQIKGTQWNEVMQDGSWLLKSHLGFCKPRQWTSHTTCASIYQRTFNRLLMKCVSVLVCCQMDCQYWTFPNKDEVDDISLVIIESHVYRILQV